MKTYGKGEGELRAEAAAKLQNHLNAILLDWY
jgi:hypothetical protein